MGDDNDFGLDDAFVEELKQEFLTEVSFLIEECEASFLKLDKPEHREEELKNIFRLAHSIKGSGQAVGFLDLSKFAHALEDLLAVLRDQPSLVTESICGLLLEAGDSIKERVAALQAKSEESWDPSELETKLREQTNLLLGNAPATESASTPFPEENQVSSEAPPPLAQMDPVEEVIPSTPLPTPITTPTASQSLSSASAADTSPKMEANAKKQPTNAAGQTVKVDLGRIESVLDLVGELVIIKSQMMHHPLVSESSDLRLNSVVNLLDKTVRSLQDKTLSMRMTSLRPTFLKLQRIVRDLSIKLGKPVDFHMEGEDTEIDRNMIELLTDPLTHLIRNSIDHGVEKKEKRLAANKPETAKVSLIARQSNGRVLIEIKDDGAGISREKVLQKARSKGLIDLSRKDESFSDKEAQMLIFKPGFSTAEAVTDVSGRGVGLDVVKNNVEKVKGYIDIESEEGKGSVFRLSLPLTTAITDGMMIEVENVKYILPMAGIREIVRPDQDSLTDLNEDTRLLKIRGKFSPVVCLDDILDAELMEKYRSSDEENEVKLAQFKPDNHVYIVVEHMANLFALRVDAILGQAQVVVKALGESFDTTKGVSGGAILGDGKVSLVLDLDGLVRQFNLMSAKLPVAKEA